MDRTWVTNNQRLCAGGVINPTSCCCNTAAAPVKSQLPRIHNASTLSSSQMTERLPRSRTTSNTHQLPSASGAGRKVAALEGVQYTADPHQFSRLPLDLWPGVLDASTGSYFDRCADCEQIRQLRYRVRHTCGGLLSCPVCTFSALACVQKVIQARVVSTPLRDDACNPVGGVHSHTVCSHSMVS
jgi:hypothetical protein